MIFFFFQVVEAEPLAVRFFMGGKKGFFTATDYAQEVLREDVAKPLPEPETVTRGSRTYYKWVDI